MTEADAKIAQATVLFERMCRRCGPNARRDEIHKFVGMFLAAMEELHKMQQTSGEPEL